MKRAGIPGKGTQQVKKWTIIHYQHLTPHSSPLTATINSSPSMATTEQELALSFQKKFPLKEGHCTEDVIDVDAFDAFFEDPENADCPEQERMSLFLEQGLSKRQKKKLQRANILKKKPLPLRKLAPRKLEFKSGKPESSSPVQSKLRGRLLLIDFQKALAMNMFNV